MKPLEDVISSAMESQMDALRNYLRDNHKHSIEALDDREVIWWAVLIAGQYAIREGYLCSHKEKA